MTNDNVSYMFHRVAFKSVRRCGSIVAKNFKKMLPALVLCIAIRAEF